MPRGWSGVAGMFAAMALKGERSVILTGGPGVVAPQQRQVPNTRGLWRVVRAAPEGAIETALSRVPGASFEHSGTCGGRRTGICISACTCGGTQLACT